MTKAYKNLLSLSTLEWVEGAYSGKAGMNSECYLPRRVGSLGHKWR